jgi:hypothetical protein
MLESNTRIYNLLPILHINPDYLDTYNQSCIAIFIERIAIFNKPFNYIPKERDFQQFSDRQMPAKVIELIKVDFVMIAVQS